MNLAGARRAISTDNSPMEVRICPVTPGFDLYRSAEEHEELRAAIRALSEK